MQETEETYVQSLGLEDALEESMATHSSILAWEIAGTEGPRRPQSTRWCWIWHDRSDLANTHTHTHTHTIINYMCQKYQVLDQTSL